MYLLVADETNKSPAQNAKFLIYGGLIVPVAALPDLNREFEEIRAKAGYQAGDEFKFHTRARPKHVSKQAGDQAKQDAIAACKRFGCNFVAQVSLHALIKSKDQDEQLLFAANAVIAAFNKFLVEQDAHGLCLLDNLPVKKQWQYLSEKFTVGLTFPGRMSRRLDRVCLFGATCLNAGHVNSAMDIVLGTFRYCVNGPPSDGPARAMLRSVMPLMLGKPRNGKRIITEHGLLLRPRSVQAPAFRREYDLLVEQLNVLAAGA